MSVTALLLVLLSQDDPARLVEELRSDRVEDRQKAETALRKLGEAAVPALEKAARDPDPELSSRAATLLRILALNREMPAALRAKHPQLAERLAKGDDALWTETFLQHFWTWDHEGLDFLVARAIRGRHKAADGDGLLRLMVRQHPFPSAIPELVQIVHQGNEDDRTAALEYLRGYGYEWRQSPMDVLSGIPPTVFESPADVRRAVASCFPLIRAMVDHALPEVRFQGAILLGRFGSRESVPALLKLIEKDTVEIRRASVEALIVLKAPEATPFVLENLKSPDAGVRTRSIEAIERLGAKEHSKAVAGMMTDSSAMVAGQAMVTLSRMGATEYRPAVSAYLESPSSAVRYYAVIALGFYDAKDLTGAIAGRLNDDDVEVRWAAIVALGALGAKDAVPELEKLLKAPLEKTRLLARKSLDRIARPPAPPAPPRESLPAPLLEAIPALADEQAWIAGFLETTDREKHATLRAKDVEPLARAALARARTPQEKAQVSEAIAAWDLVSLAPGLIPFLADTDAAERALLDLDARACAPELVALLEQPPQVCDRAARLLNHLDPARTDPLVLKHLDSPRTALKVLGIGASARLGKKDAAPKILQLLEHEDAEIAREAGRALAQLGAVEAVPRLVRLLGQGEEMPMAILPAIAQLDRAEGRRQGERLLTHSNDRIRETALQFLAENGYRESMPEIWKGWDGEVWFRVAWAVVRLDARDRIPALLKAIEDPRRRDRAVEELGRLGAREAIPAIRPLLRSESKDLRYAAASALADLGDRESIQAIETLLDSKDPFVRAEACRFFGRLGSTGRLRKLLEDPEADVADAAAVALGDPAVLSAVFKKADSERRLSLLDAVIRLGDVETLRALPEPRGILLVRHGNSLNALRTPDAWRRLREAKLPRDLEGTGKEVLEAISRQSGLTLEGGGDLTRPVYVSSRGGLATLLDALGRLDTLYLAYILENDRIRIISGQDAWAFWRSWCREFESRK